MIYSTEDKLFKVMHTAFSGETNDVLICSDLNTNANNLHTLWVVKKHIKARTLLRILTSVESSSQENIQCFTFHEYCGIVLPYHRERKLYDFYMGENYELSVCEQICRNLIAECMACNMPYPILYLVLIQQRINISSDDRIYFDYQIDLSKLDERKTQKDCCNVCSEIILHLLSVKSSKQMVSYTLLKLKTRRENYCFFSDIYKDIVRIKISDKKYTLRQRLKKALDKKKNMFSYLLIIVCLALGSISFLMLLSQLIWGDIPWLNLSGKTYQTIGTESLLQ